MPVSRARQSEMRAALMEITGSSSSEATQILQANNWNLERSIDAHFSGRTSTNTASSTLNAKNPRSAKEVEQVFDKYKDENDPETIGIDGTLAYIEDLGYQPEDLAILALAEFLKSPSTGVFKKEDFVASWSVCGITTLDQMKTRVTSFEHQLNNDPAYFQKIYEFAFKYTLEPGQRSLNPDIAVEYWCLFLPVLFEKAKVDQWCKFITDNHKYAISKDQWQMTFEFFRWWKEHDLKEYDESLAWPSLIDSFVEHETETS